MMLWRFYEQVKEEMLFEALTTRKTVTVGERLIVPYKLSEVRSQLNTGFKFYEFEHLMCGEISELTPRVENILRRNLKGEHTY